MKFSYITPRPTCNEQSKVDRKNFKKLNEIIGKHPKQKLSLL
ncbi:hypothetical protein [Wolbachia endosymbiont of Litomosoides sigmodontis]|nr:hypothetical protein [Wolbachia endosymbiont of Litomosoides sigmodontis]